MVGPSNNNPLQIFSMKLSSSSTLTSMKIKTLIHFLDRVFSKGKSFLIRTLKEKQPIHFIFPRKNSKTKRNMKNIVFGSFRLHYNWCSSSHVVPLPAPYYSTWNSIVSTEQCEEEGKTVAKSQHLSGYLEWLEEKVDDDNGDENEIDRLADLFIANCHEKFILEKQESYRNFHEMLARSV